MPTISLKDGRNINSDHVLQYQSLKNGEIRFLLSTGAELIGDASSDPSDAFLSVIPANPGFVAVYAEHLSYGSFRYSLRSVIAWKVACSGNWPIFEGCDRYENPDYEVMIDPAGGVFDSDGNTFASLEEWKREFEAEPLIEEAA